MKFDNSGDDAPNGTADGPVGQDLGVVIHFV